MRITTKRVRMALRSPRRFVWAARQLLRQSPLGAIERKCLRGYSLRPAIIAINITGRCNLRCEMCMQPRGEAGDDDTTTLRSTAGGELTPEEWIGVVDQAASAQPAFYFSGGEPLLYRGLDRILAHIKSKGMIAALVTNGTMLRHHAERLVEIGVDNITISIDGPQPIHDIIRGVPGTFDKAMEGIRALRQARGTRTYPAIKINCVVTPTSLPTLYETFEVAREAGVDEFNLQHPIFDTAENVALHNRIFPGIIGEEPSASSACPSAAIDESKQEGEFYEARLTPEQFKKLEAVVQRISTEAKGHPPVSFFPDVKRVDWEGYYLNLNHPFPQKCTTPWSMMRLLADGTFEPCLHHAIDNVRDTPLWTTWNAPRIRHFRRLLAQGTLFPACARCCYRCY